MGILEVTSLNTSVDIELPAMATEQDFIDFCLANRELRIERTAQGKIIVTPPAFSDTGASNFKLAVEVGKWVDQDGTGIGFDSSSGFTLPNGATRSPEYFMDSIRPMECPHSGTTKVFCTYLPRFCY